MAEIVKNYQLEKINGAKNYKRIINEIKKVKNITSASIDKDKSILRIELSMNLEDRKSEVELEAIEAKMLKAIRTYEKKAEFKPIVSEEVYRKVLYLNGLDCSHCATKVETIAKKTLNYNKLLVDFASYRFIIESSDKALMDNILEEVSNIAKRVDPKIVVTESNITPAEREEEAQRRLLPKVIIITLACLSFILAVLVYLNFDISKIVDLLKHEDVWTDFFSKSSNERVHVYLLLVTYGLFGYHVIWEFAKNLVHGRIFDEHCLMTIASIGAIITGHIIEAIAVMVLFQLGEHLQERAVNHCRKSIADLLKIDVKIARLKKGEDVVEIGVESILPDDVIIVNKGEMIPLDGLLVDGSTVIDNKNLTGESLLKKVTKGEEIMAGSINMGKVIEIRVLRPYSESMITKILDLVENASTSKARAENFITKFSKIYTPLVLICSVIIAVGGYFGTKYLWGNPWQVEPLDWVYRAMLFLVISCPCALVISIPLCFFSGIGVASRRGILIKGSNYLEALYNVENVVFDKTGTLTKGEFKITEVVPVVDTITPEELLRVLIYVEYYSNHPIGISVVEEYGRTNVFPEIISDFTEGPGGAQATVNGKRVIAGNAKIMKTLKMDVPEVDVNGLVVYIVRDKVYLGYVVIGDVIRDDASSSIAKLRQMGVKKFYMLTGDSKGIAENVGNTLGIDEVYSELLPDQKVEKLTQIKQEAKSGRTIYIGDGINDAPVIANSDVGIAMGTTGSDATIAIADVVIMSDNMNKLPELATIAKKTRIKVIENIVISLLCKSIVLVLSVIPQISIPLWLAIFSDVGISLIAIANSIMIMRLFQKKSKETIPIGEAINE